MPLLRSKVSTVSSPPCHLTEDALVAGFSGNGGADTLLWVEDVSTLALSVMEVPLVLAQDEVGRVLAPHPGVEAVWQPTA